MQLNQFSLRVPEGNELPSGHVEVPHKQEYSILIHNHRATDCIAQIHVDGKDVGRFHVKAKSNLRVEHPENCNRRFLFLKADTTEANDADGQSVGKDDRGLVQVTFIPLKGGVQKSDVEKMMEELRKLSHHYHYHHYWDRQWHDYWPRPWTRPYVTWYSGSSGGYSLTHGASDSSIGSQSTFCCTNDCHDAGSGHIGKWEGEPHQGIQDNTGQHTPGITGLGSISDQDIPVPDGTEQLTDEEPTVLSLRLVAVPEQRKAVAPLRPILRGNPVPQPVGT